MEKLKSRIKQQVSNFLGKKLKNRYLVIESDDWGSERMPSKKVMNSLKSQGFNLNSNPFNYKDSLETEDDLSALFEVLNTFRDYKGNKPVITANSVTANPDFNRIRSSNFRKYFYESVADTYHGKKGCENNIKIIKQGISEGIYFPQFHGREHLNIERWMDSLRNRDKKVSEAFDAGVYAVDFENKIMKRDNYMAAFDSTGEDQSNVYPNIIEEGTKMFEELFGYVSKSFIAPCYVWHPSLEPTLSANGIQYIQGLPVQLVPSEGLKYKRKFHYQGQRNRLNQIYFVRNCFFEPSINSRINWVEDCIERLNIIFSHGKPAILGTHRINFIGSLDEVNRKQNLDQFAILLNLILKQWPDIEFITTDRLGKKYKKSVK